MSKTRKSDREDSPATTPASAVELDESELEDTVGGSAIGTPYDKMDLSRFEAPQASSELSANRDVRWPCKWRQHP